MALNLQDKQAIVAEVSEVSKARCLRLLRIPVALP